MTLGDCIKEYREYHDYSQRQFAEMCSLSNAYISILEKNINPKTGEPPVPTYGVFQKVATAMGISVHELMEKANESQVSIGSNMTLDNPVMSLNPDIMDALKNRAESAENSLEKDLLDMFFTMTDSDKEKLIDYARYIVDSYNRPDKRRK